MPILSLQSLRATKTPEEATQILLDYLKSLGFNATSWQSGSVQRSFVQVAGYVWSWASDAVATITEMGLNDTSSGDALTAFSASHYDNTRSEAVATQGYILLTDTANVGPITIEVGQLVVSDALGHYYRNTESKTINQGDSESVLFQAEQAGEDYNVANNTITTFITPLAGFTCNNPDHDSTGSWITTNGADAESDAELRERNRAKWSVLSVAGPKDAYIFFAKDVAPSTVTRVKVDDENPRGPGTVDVYIASSSGAISSGSTIFTAVQTEMDLRRPISSDFLVKEVSTHAITFTGTVYINSTDNNAITQAAIVEAIDDYISSVPIGGSNVSGIGGAVIRDEIIDAVMSIDGVLKANILLDGVADDIALDDDEIPTVGSTAGITFTSVASDS